MYQVRQAPLSSTHFAVSNIICKQLSVHCVCVQFEAATSSSGALIHQYWGANWLTISTYYYVDMLNYINRTMYC